MTADSGAASSWRNGNGVTLPECLRHAAVSEGIATGTSYPLPCLGRAITAEHCEELEPAGTCWVCSEPSAQLTGLGLSSCTQACLSSKFQCWAPGDERHVAAQRGVVLGMHKAECPVSQDADT